MNDNKIFISSRIFEDGKNKFLMENIGIIRANPFKSDRLTVNIGSQYFEISIPKLEDVLKVQKAFHEKTRKVHGRPATRNTIYKHRASIYRIIGKN